MNDYYFPDDGLLHRLTSTADIPSGPGIDIVAVFIERGGQQPPSKGTVRSPPSMIVSPPQRQNEDAVRAS